LKSEEWTFLACVTLGAGHALSFLVTRWNAGAKAWVTTRAARSLEDADCIRIVPLSHRGEGEIVALEKRVPSDPSTFTFSYQRDTYSVHSSDPITFGLLPYPSSTHPSLETYRVPRCLKSADLPALLSMYGKNEFNIPIPSFSALFAEHATAPFFVFQIFCVALWCLDEYWYYSLFTLFMLVVFECTVVWQVSTNIQPSVGGADLTFIISQRVKTLTEFRTMSVVPFPIQVLRDSRWSTIQSDDLVPGDVVSIGELYRFRTCNILTLDKVRSHSAETNVPADILLVQGSCIVNEAMLSGESTPLLKESVQLLEGSEKLDVDGQHKNEVLFSGTKLLQASSAGITPDGGCVGVVLRTGFGTAQGQLVRTMIFSTERVSANNLESFLFIGFLLIFAIAASWYVWVKGMISSGQLFRRCCNVSA